jgi:CRP/FNR family transcriptional regulator, cyclic AMP receptor protein
MSNPPLSRGAAAHLLITESALAELSLNDALVVIDHMQPRNVSAGTVLIREGDRRKGSFMLLVIEGEVTVESRSVDDANHLVLNVLGPGSLIGEMALLDDQPRAASCTASSDLQMAILTREALQTIMQTQPAVGARLMLAVSKRLADRLRETLRKLKTHVRVNQAMRQELDAMMSAQTAPRESGLRRSGISL